MEREYPDGLTNRVRSPATIHYYMLISLLSTHRWWTTHEGCIRVRARMARGNLKNCLEFSHSRMNYWQVDASMHHHSKEVLQSRIFVSREARRIVSLPLFGLMERPRCGEEGQLERDGWMGLIFDLLPLTSRCIDCRHSSSTMTTSVVHLWRLPFDTLKTLQNLICSSISIREWTWRIELRRQNFSSSSSHHTNIW